MCILFYVTDTFLAACGPAPVDQIEDQEEAGEDTEKRHVSPGESLTAGS